MALKDTISSIVVFVFSLVAWWLARDFGGGAELFPRGIAVIMMAVSALMFVRAVAAPRLIPQGIEVLNRSDRIRTAICVAMTVAYVALIVPLGFVVSSIALIVGMSYVLGMRNHVAIWFTAVGFVGILWLLFVRVFHTPLPISPFFNSF